MLDLLERWAVWPDTLEEFDQIGQSVRAENAKFDHEINVCMGTGCLSQHSDKLKDAHQCSFSLRWRGLVRRTGCINQQAACGPLVLLTPKRRSPACQSRQC